MKSVRQANPTLAMSTPDATMFGRRKALHHLWGRAFAVVASIPVAQALAVPDAEALDMDAFANSQVSCLFIMTVLLTFDFGPISLTNFLFNSSKVIARTAIQS
jgi:hypothetical protein